MLTRERETCGPDSAFLEDDAVLVESCEGIINGVKHLVVDCWVPHKVAEVKKSAYSMYHTGGGHGLQLRVDKPIGHQSVGSKM